MPGRDAENPHSGTRDGAHASGVRRCVAALIFDMAGSVIADLRETAGVCTFERRRSRWRRVAEPFGIVTAVSAAAVAVGREGQTRVAVRAGPGFAAAEWADRRPLPCQPLPRPRPASAASQVAGMPYSAAQRGNLG